MRKRTFEDRKFSQGDANSDAFRANWDSIFGNDSSKETDRSSPSSDVMIAVGSTEQAPTK